MQADQRHLLQRPAEPRGGQAEGRCVGQAERLARREWSAAAGRRRRSGRDRRSPARRPAGRDASRSPARRRRSGSARRACGHGSALRPGRGGVCHRPRARPTLQASAPRETTRRCRPRRCRRWTASAGPCSLRRSDMRVLILGGTTEASALAELLAGDPRFEATLSFAGRTAAPQRAADRDARRRLRRRRRPRALHQASRRSRR